MAIGVSWEQFMDSCPMDLKPYDIAHEKRIKEQDALMYMWFGNYALSAVSVAVEHCLGGKKAKSEFIKEPILSTIETKKEEEKPLTEDEIIRQTEALFGKLSVLGANHRLSKLKEDN